MFIKIIYVNENINLFFNEFDTVKKINSYSIFKDNNIISSFALPVDVNIILEKKKHKNKIILSSKNKKKLGLSKSLILYNLNYKSKKYKIKLIINGIGQKIKHFSDLNILNLKLGYSHDIKLKIPENIKLKIIKSKEIILSSYDLNNLTQFAHNIKKLKKIDIYKGKGILFKNEIILKKEGKKTK